MKNSSLRNPLRNPLIAPLGHTVIVLAVLLVVTLFGYYARQSALTASTHPSDASKAILYISILALQFGLFRLIILGIRRGGRSLSDIIGIHGWHIRLLLRDVAFAAIVLAAAVSVSIAIRLYGGDVDSRVGSLLPTNGFQTVLWIILSGAAGFVEELCYRGYLQQQALAVTGSSLVAIGIQALLFAASHSYQGLKSTIVVLVLGLVFGVAAYLRKGILPVIIAHSLYDAVEGLLAGHFS